MKKLILLAGLCLLLAGCNPRSRQPSENFIPSGDPPAETGSRASGETEDSSVSPDDWDWSRPSGGIVKQVYFREGDYTCEGTKVHYSYSLPMVDLSSEYAMLCNQLIELTFGNPIRDSIGKMEHFEPLDVQTVSYTEDIFGSVLTVRICMTDTKGEQTWELYSLNAVTGDEATYQEFLAAAGLQENLVPNLLAEAVEIRFREMVGNRYRETDHRFTRALNESLAGVADPSRLGMHLTEDGKLAFSVIVSDPGGGGYQQELILP